jgi:hypothetical protein
MPPPIVVTTFGPGTTETMATTPRSAPSKEITHVTGERQRPKPTPAPAPVTARCVVAVDSNGAPEPELASDLKRAADTSAIQPALASTTLRRLAHGDATVLREQRQCASLLLGVVTIASGDPDAGLQGLITTNVSLAIRRFDGDALRDSFTVRARGGGFTAAESIGQARERLSAALPEQLRAR